MSTKIPGLLAIGRPLEKNGGRDYLDKHVEAAQGLDASDFADDRFSVSILIIRHIRTQSPSPSTA